MSVRSLLTRRLPVPRGIGPAVGGDAVQGPLHQERQGVPVALIPEVLGEVSEVEGSMLSNLLVVALFLKVPDEVHLPVSGRIVSGAGLVGHALVDEGGDDDVIGHQLQLVQVLQGRPDLVLVQPGGGHQLVRRYSLVRRGIQYPGDDVQELASVFPGQPLMGSKDAPCLVQVGHPY